MPAKRRRSRAATSSRSRRIPVSSFQLSVGQPNARGVCSVEFQHGNTRHRDRINPDSARSRNQFIAAVAKKINSTPDTLGGLEDVILQRADEAKEASVVNATPQRSEDLVRPEDDSSNAAHEVDPVMWEAAQALLQSPNVLQEICADIAALGVVGESSLAMIIYLLCTSRLLDKPMSACIQSPSSSGKSHVASVTISLMPPEHVLAATAFSPTALYNMPPGGLEHKIVFTAERRHARARVGSTAANDTLALRELLSNGEINRCVTGSNGQVRNCRQKGPVAYLETTTQTQIFDEDASRMLMLVTDISPDQTRRIIAAKAKLAAGNGPDAEHQDLIRKKHHVAQRMLKLLPVAIPYAEHITISTRDLGARRAFDHLLTGIRAHALLCQMSRETVDGVIQATADDYAAAYSLLMPVLRRTLYPLREKQLDLVRVLADESKGRPFDMKSMEKWTKVARTTVNDHLKPLRDAGLVEVVETQNRRKKTYRIAGQITETSVGIDGLIGPERLVEVIGLGGVAEQAATNSPEVAVNADAVAEVLSL